MGLQLWLLAVREVRTISVSMKLFLLSCLLPLALSSPDAEPGYGHGRYGHHQQRHYAPKCRTVYDTVTSSACRDITDTACITKVVTSTRTKSVPEEQCATSTKTECKNIVVTIPESVCEIVEEEVCHEEAECTTEPQCQDIKTVVTEQECQTEQQCVETQQCTTEQQCSTQEQCTTRTQVIPETTFTEECQDIVTNVCQEVHTQVQLAQRVINHPSVIAAAPAVPVLQPAGLLAPATAVG